MKRKSFFSLFIVATLMITSNAAFAENHLNSNQPTPSEDIQIQTVYDWTRTISLSPSIQKQFPGPYQGGFRIKNAVGMLDNELRITCSTGNLKLILVNTETNEEYVDYIYDGGTATFSNLGGAVHKLYMVNQGTHHLVVDCNVRTVLD